MMNVRDLMEYQLQQQIAHEIYCQHIMQRIPDPFAQMLPMPLPLSHIILPPRPTLPGCVEANLENNELWQQFHEIGTEMIITKNGRRMFPSMRLKLKGLEEESQYCVLLEMLPMGDCRYKYSGSQWMPAGGAEPQSPQRMFLHPDSPSSGAHWQSQNILFNKIKLTNNTLDGNGHIVLASMHKYQPRVHVIKTADLTQLPWAPQQSFLFPETEFIAVTAYQNDRITKLKIDNNPFAKGFRETGQSKCKRKLMTNNNSSFCCSARYDETEDDRFSTASTQDSPAKRCMFNTTATNVNLTEEANYLTMNHCYYPKLSHGMQIIANLSSLYELPHHTTFHNSCLSVSSSSSLFTSDSSSSSSPTRNFGKSADFCNNREKSALSCSNNEVGPCIESTSDPRKSPNCTKKKNNFSISAILAY